MQYIKTLVRQTFDLMRYSPFNHKQNYCTARLLSVLCPFATCKCLFLLPPKTIGLKKKRNVANCTAGFKGHQSLNLGVLLPSVALLVLQQS